MSPSCPPNLAHIRRDARRSDCPPIDAMLRICLAYRKREQFAACHHNPSLGPSRQRDVDAAAETMRIRVDALAVSLGVSLLAAGGGCQIEPTPSSPAAAIALLAAIPSLRPVAPRLTVLPNYAPCRESSPDESGDRSAVCVSLRAPGSRVESDFNRVRRAIVEHPREVEYAAATAVWLLSRDDMPRAADRAVERFQVVVRSHPSSARALSDLAAAYLVRGSVESLPADFLRSLDDLERALLLEPGLPEALFNRGLVFERLGLCAAAVASWDDYLAIDASSGWAREAAARRGSMPCHWPDWEPAKVWATGADAAAAPPPELAKLLAVTPIEVSRRTLEELLPAWAETWLAGNQEQARLRLTRIQSIADALAVRTGDAATVRLVAELGAEGQPHQARLALAYQHLGAAARLQASSLYALALTKYQQALAASGDRETGVALWARYGMITTLVTEEDYSVALRLLSELRREPGLASMPALSARIAWSEGLVQLRTGAFAESRQSFAATAAICDHLHDSVQAGAARALEAESLNALGMDDEAWRLRIAALQALGRHASGPLHNLLVDAALAGREGGWPHAALALQTAGLAVARTMRSPSRTVEALLWRSKILAALAHSAQAMADLQDAFSQVRNIADPGVRQRLSAELHEAAGSLLMGSDPALAVDELSAALHFYRQTSFAWKLPSVLLLRARARLRLGHQALAAADLEAAVGEFERRDRAMPPEIFRYSHFERAQEIFDEMIRLQVAQHRPDLALAYMERSRSAGWPV